MKKIKQYIHQHWYSILFVSIMLVATFLRFYDYPARFGLGYDQAHDAIIAHYALQHGVVPLLGPFSSAGPFQTGGEWYWIIMLGSFLFPFSAIGSWIFITIVQICFVGGMILVGEKLIDKKFGLIAGILVAVSPSQVAQSVNLTNQAPIAFLALGAIWAMICIVRNKKSLYGFLLGLFVSVAITVHMQGASLILLILLTIIIGKMSLKNILFLIIGFAIPFTPMILAEMHYGFFNTKGMMQYYLHDQYKIPLQALGRRWLTYLGVIWPDVMGNIIGGTPILGYVAFLMLIVSSIWLVVKKQLSREWIIIIVCLAGFILALRYVHTPLFDSYFMFAHPFIFFILSLFFWLCFKNRKYALIGLIILVVFVGGSLYTDRLQVFESSNQTSSLVQKWEVAMKKDYPGKKFDLYDYVYRNRAFTFPLMLSLQYDNLLSPSGERIAFGKPTIIEDPVKNKWFTEIKNNKGGFDLLDAQSSSSAELSQAGWTRISPELTYNATELWYIKK